MTGGSISRILYFRLLPFVQRATYEASIIYLLQPTPQQRTGSPWMLVYMALQVVVGYHIYVAAYVCELLPHFFTLTTAACIKTSCLRFRASYLWRLFSVTPSISFHLSALSAVQCPFLSGLSSRFCWLASFPSDRTTHRSCKGIKIFLIPICMLFW